LQLTFDDNRNIVSGSVSRYTQVHQQLAVVKIRESLDIRKHTLCYCNEFVFANPVNIAGLQKLHRPILNIFWSYQTLRGLQSPNTALLTFRVHTCICSMIFERSPAYSFPIGRTELCMSVDSKGRTCPSVPGVILRKPTHGKTTHDAVHLVAGDGLVVAVDEHLGRTCSVVQFCRQHLIERYNLGSR